jgi:hypothetical protein
MLTYMTIVVTFVNVFAMYILIAYQKHNAKVLRKSIKWPTEA